MMGHEMKPMNQRLVIGGARQNARDPQDAPVKLFLTAPGSKVHVIADRVRIDIDQRESPVWFQRIGNGVQIRQCQTAGWIQGKPGWRARVARRGS